jgi:hypothetical protein
MTMTARTPLPPLPAAALRNTESELTPLLRKTSAATRQAEASPASVQGITIATVVASHSDDSHDVCVSSATGAPHPLPCRRAASCLLVPAPGDTVMVAGASEDALYLIAVIAQADPGHATLAVGGELTLRSTGALALQSDTAVHTHAPEWQLNAERAQCKVDTLDYQGAEVRFSVLVSRFVGRACEVVLDRLHLLTRSSFRLTEEVEQVRAGQIDMQASSTLRLHAKNTLVTSTELVKVDAEQIHMG